MDSLLKIVFFTTIVSTIFRSCSTLKPWTTQDAINLATDPIMEKYTYVDKTSFVLKLLKDHQKRYFFSRPRRFGKTIFLRTVEGVFDHHRDGKRIFKGTDIANSSHDWDGEKYPVMFFDLSAGTLESAFNTELLRFKRVEELSNIPEECMFISPNKTQEPPLQVQQFAEILCTASVFGKRPVVILVDEYDYHIIKNSNNPAGLEHVKDFVRNFCVEIKNSAHRIKLAVVTGITRSSFLHYGSSGGDFTDISDAIEYGAIAGFTDEEMTRYFQPAIKKVADARGVTPENIHKEIKEWYDSYAFTSGLEKIYNPKSISRYFATGVANIYWPQEGRASFFWDQLLRRPTDFSDLEGDIRSNLKYTGSINEAPPAALMYDTGYLTIGEVNHTNDGKPYQLRFPNKEVREAFFEDFVAVTKKNKPGDLDPYIAQIREALTSTSEPDFNHFMAVADTAIRFWPFKCRFEEGYNLHLAALMYMAGFNVRPQWYSELAIIDVLDVSSETILLFELKLDRSGFTEAWKHARRSIDGYFFRQRKILAAGISLTSKRNDTVVAGWRAELYAPNGTLLKSYKHEESEWYNKWRYLAGTPRSKKTKRSLNHKAFEGVSFS